jgi:ribonuclease HII
MADLTMELEIGGLVAGCDEAGRGSWAGPIVAAAVILPRSVILPGVDDSKSVDKKNHRELAEMILREAVSVGIGVAGNDLIDRKGVGFANKYVIKNAVEDLGIVPDFLLIDGGPQQEIDVDIPQREVPKGDQKSLSIAAASIIAKSVHDELMCRYAKRYPQYGWKENTGYGTMGHKYAIYQYGICEYHRRSFKPIREYLQKEDARAHRDMAC